MRRFTLTTGPLNLHEYGAPDGEPLFFFHGWPGSGLQAALLDAAARRQGFRVLAPERPGIGGSPYVADRKISDWPAVVAELADALKLERFAVMGVSGGGPYALACASALPQHVRAAVVVCGAPPIAEMAHRGQLHPSYQFLLWLFARRPHLVRTLFQWARPLMQWTSAECCLHPLRILLPRPDAETLDDPPTFQYVFRCQADAFADVDGLFDDAALYARSWGFSPEAIRLPVQFWHGTEDSNFHWRLAEELAARVPGAKLRIVPDEGHFSLPIRQADTILATLRQALKAST